MGSLCIINEYVIVIDRENWFIFQWGDGFRWRSLETLYIPINFDCVGTGPRSGQPPAVGQSSSKLILGRQ